MERERGGDDLAVAVAAAVAEPQLTAAVHDALDGPPDPIALLRRAVGVLVPSYADGCEVDVRSDRGIARIVLGTDPEWARRREEVPLPPGDADHPLVAMLGGAPARRLDIDDPDDRRLFGSADDPTSARALGMKSVVLAPVVARGAIVGSLALARGPSGRRFDRTDVDVVVDLGRRLGLAWHNAVLLAERATIFASLHDGLVVTDADGVVQEVNRSWLEMTGFREEECVGATMPYPWWPTAEEHPEALAEAGVAAAEVLEHGSGEHRVVLKRADGTFFPALSSVAPVVDRASGHRRGLVASIKDVTGWEEARADLFALQRTTAALAAASGRDEVAKAALEEAMARFGADAGLVMLLAEDGQRLEIAGQRGLDAEQQEAWAEIPVHRDTPSAHAARDGTFVAVPDPEALAARFPGLGDAWAAARLAAVCAAPIAWDGRPRGALTLCWSRPRPLSEAEQALLEAIAAQCGEALRRAEGYEVEHRTSQVLQRRLLSDVPVLDERATVVARYRPASADLAVGGDWYDVMHLGGGRLAVVVGDVVGSGIHAAAVMGQLRSALRGIVAVQPEAVAALESLDRLAATIDGAPGATVCYAEVDFAAGRLRFARAGHPPPVLAGAGGGAQFLEGHADPPVGFARAPRRAEEVALDPGDVLLLYTDGLVERRETQLGERLDLLLEACGTARRTVLDDLVDDVLLACAGGGTRRDDTAVLAVRDEPAGPDRLRQLERATPRTLAPTRRALREWLAAAGVPPNTVDDVVLAASEVLTNAVEHAYRGPSVLHGLVSLAARVLDGEVVVEVRDAGTWKDSPSSTIRGRGLTIARAVLGSVDVHTGPSGTTAVLRTPVDGVTRGA